MDNAIFQYPYAVFRKRIVLFEQIATKPQALSSPDPNAQILSLLNITPAPVETSQEVVLFTGGHDKIVFSWKLDARRPDFYNFSHCQDRRGLS